MGYALRCAGDRISASHINTFDQDQRIAIEDALGGSLNDESWLQATLGVRASGLGLREASEVAQPAFLASQKAGHAAAAGLVSLPLFEQQYDARTSAAVMSFRTSLPSAVSPELDLILEDATADVAQRWANLKAGRSGPGASAQGPSRPPGGVWFQRQATKTQSIPHPTETTALVTCRPD